MKCMKCGASIPSGQVFCADCLADMAAHPVRPDAPVLLPRREKQTAAKRSKKKVRKPEEQVTVLRKTVAFLLMLVLVLCIALTVSIYVLFQHIAEDSNPLQPGQNYGTSESVE